MTVVRRAGCSLLTLACLSLGCRDVTAPPRRGGPPYIAVVTKYDAPTSKILGSYYRYRIRELSGTIKFDTLIVVPPTDTVIVSVVPATYAVSLAGVPPQCHLRGSADQLILVPEKSNTSLARYFVRCETQLTVVVTASGYHAGDAAPIYALTSVDDRQRKGIIHGGDTLTFDGLPSGPATFDLAGLPDHCEVTTNGGFRQSVLIDSTVSASLRFDITCSDPAHRPQVTAFRSSYHDGSGAVFFKVTDPDRDVDRYYWDITDCRRNTLLPTGPRLRRPLSTAQNQWRDTVTIVGGFDLGIPDDSIRGKCAVLWVADQSANMSTVSQISLGGRGRPPVAADFNARFLGIGVLKTDVRPVDPDSNFVGLFPMFKVRAGIFGPASSTTSVLLYNATGVIGDVVPDIAMTGDPFVYSNFLGVALFLIDAGGNFVRAEDNDLFQ